MGIGGNRVRWMPWIISNKRTKFFMWSHIIGWAVAWVQTIWIILLMRYYYRNTMKELRRRH